MSDSQNMSDEVRARLRAIPSVNELLAEWPVVKAAGETCDAVVHAAVTAGSGRSAPRFVPVPLRVSSASWPRLLSGAPTVLRCRACAPPSTPQVLLSIPIWVEARSRSRPPRPWPRSRAATAHSSTAWTPVRAGRARACRWRVRSLTGAEDALVVNNNAAAVLLVLATHAAGKEVIVSRGELVEIGGSFRIPDVMAASGAKLVEVSAATAHLGDYERAITPETAMMLEGPSFNYRIEGFHEEVSSREALAAQPISMACCSMKTRAPGALLPDDILVRGEETAGFGFGRGSIWCRARAINCSVPHRRASSWAVVTWSRLVDRIRLCAPCARASWRSRRSRPRCVSTWMAPMLPIAIFRYSACSRFRRLIWSDVPASCSTVWSPRLDKAGCPCAVQSVLENRQPPVAARCLPWSCPRCALLYVLLTSA